MCKCKVNFYYFVWMVHSVIGRPYDQDDHMGKMDKIKMMWLTDDIMRDTMLKMRQIIDIREEHELYIAFNVGVLIGKIREKYRHMVEIYKENLDKSTNRIRYYGPGMHVYRPFHNIITLEMMHYIFVEIDQLVHVIVTQAADELNTDNLMVPSTGKKTKMRAGEDSAEEPLGAPPEAFRAHSHHQTESSASELVFGDKLKVVLQLRKRDVAVHVKRHLSLTPEKLLQCYDNDELKDIKDMVEEESVKNKIRQEYLNKRLGRPANLTTTRKRFMNQWPVEDTWSLEEYSVG